jgi:hypothetical protein
MIPGRLSVLFLRRAFRFPDVLFPSIEAIRAGFQVIEFFWCKQKFIIHGDLQKAFWRNTWHGSKTFCAAASCLE